MIPVKLTIQGLYSYQKKQTIDFSKLTDAGLFGIFGGVGSGKSTILEAITYALYAESDRLNQRDNRNYNMMNLKSDEMLIDFIFKAGKNGKIYRSKVESKRNKKNFETVNTPDRTTYKNIDGEWVPVDREVIERTLGLSYNNFKRTIIIPQGKFQEFLQLGNTDRTRMMKELFGLEKFELLRQVSSLDKKNNEQKNRVEGQLQNIGDLDPKQVEVYKEVLKNLEEEIKKLDSELKDFRQNEQELKSLYELIEKRKKAEKLYNELLAQKDSFQNLDDKINLYEYCLNRFKNPLDNLKDSKIKEENRNNLIKADQEKLKSETTIIEQIEDKIEKIKPEYEYRSNLKIKAEDLKMISKIKIVVNSISEESERVKKGEKYWTDCNAEANNLKIFIKQQEEQLKILRNELPDLALLSTIKTWHIEMQNLNEKMNEIEGLIRNAISNFVEVEKKRVEILTFSFFRTLKPETDFTAMKSYLDTTEKETKEKQKALIEHTTHLRIKEALQDYADNLKEGDPCPVCGSTHHPDTYKAEDIKEQHEKAIKEADNLNYQLNYISVMYKSIERLEGNIEQSHKDEIKYTSDKVKQAELIEAHKQKFVWDKYHDKEELESAFKEAQKINKDIKELEEEIGKNTKKKERFDEKIEAARLRLDELRISLTRHKTELTVLSGQLKVIKPDDYRNTSFETIEREEKNLLNHIENIEKEYIGETEKRLKHKSEKDKIEIRLEIHKKELLNEQSAISKLEKDINNELLKSEFNSLEEVEIILSDAMDLDSDKQRLKEYYENILKSETELDQHTKSIGDRSYNLELHKELSVKIEELNNQKEQKINDKGKTAILLEDLEKKLKSQTSLLKEFDALEKRAENIKTMRSLFTAGGFVNYISSVYLQNLCNAANDRFFQLTRQRLSLEITKDNNFQIRDYMNAGKERSVKTLSGGQTFQASLSLALALADNIQKITHSDQNFFFLDEGFGTLDKESLDIVFETLKSLRKENRIVGVISHVEEMQQEIEVHLRIENDENSGSIIHYSWKE